MLNPTTSFPVLAQSPLLCHPTGPGIPILNSNTVEVPLSKCLITKDGKLPNSNKRAVFFTYRPGMAGRNPGADVMLKSRATRQCGEDRSAKPYAIQKPANCPIHAPVGIRIFKRLILKDI